MITNKLVMYGCVVQAVMEKLLIVWTCYMLVEFLNTNVNLLDATGMGFEGTVKAGEGFNIKKGRLRQPPTVLWLRPVPAPPCRTLRAGQRRHPALPS